MKYLYIAIVLLVFAGGIIFAYRKAGNSAPRDSGKIKVTASFYPLYFFATQIGGDRVDVSNITPAGSEPHDYEPTTGDIARIENSDILILNGGVEAWGDKIKDELSGKDVKIVTAGEGLLTKTLVEEGKPGVDPHVWLDPILAKKEVSKITDAIVLVDPKNKDYYISNELKLDSELDDLDSQYRMGLSSCQQKDIVTSHAAFAYLAQRYGLNQVAIAGLSPDEEPSSQQLADVVNFVKQRKIKYIFFESLVSPKLSDTIASEVGAKTLVLDPIEGIPQDQLSVGQSYMTVMKNNLQNLQIALECSK